MSENKSLLFNHLLTTILPVEISKLILKYHTHILYSDNCANCKKTTTNGFTKCKKCCNYLCEECHIKIYRI